MPAQTQASVPAEVMTTRLASLSSAFCRIQAECMQDVPLLNPALSVATVGFRRWQAYWLGVLVTPWMMKLIGLPLLMQPLAQAEVNWQFPSGQYTLTRDVLPEVGAYYSVSLFSPMHEFHEQAQAEATASAVMQNLFEGSREQRAVSSLPGNQQAARGMTRRELLFGLFRDNKYG
jgi:[NiFe] hydrogenase assembly HybE family chaperone